MPLFAGASSPGGGDAIGDPPPPPNEEVGGGGSDGGDGIGEPPPGSDGDVGGGGSDGGELIEEDTVDPSLLELTVSPRVFFANGLQGSLISASLSETATVRLVISNNTSEPVFLKTWESVNAFEVFWQALDEDEKSLPDGQYILTVTLTDEAANEAEVPLGIITVVSVRQLIAAAYEELLLADEPKVHSTLNLLRTVLAERYWFDANTLVMKHARSVEARLDNAVRLLGKTEYTEITEQVRLARENVVVATE